jgi:hypothetical protein
VARRAHDREAAARGGAELTREQREQLLELIDGWKDSDRLNAAMGILCWLWPEGMEWFVRREETIEMVREPCNALLLNLVEKDGHLGQVGTAACLYILDVIRQWTEDEEAKRGIK